MNLICLGTLNDIRCKYSAEDGVVEDGAPFMNLISLEVLGELGKIVNGAAIISLVELDTKST